MLARNTWCGLYLVQVGFRSFYLDAEMYVMRLLLILFLLVNSKIHYHATMIQIVSFLYKCKTPCPTLQITLIWEHNYKEKLKTRIFTCEHVNHNYIVRESCSLGRFG